MTSFGSSIARWAAETLIEMLKSLCTWLLRALDTFLWARPPSRVTSPEYHKALAWLRHSQWLRALH